MTYIERDTSREITKQVIEARILGATFDMAFYADDTIVVFSSKEACEELLEQIERISGQYGLELNKDKCVNLNMNTDEQQTFRGGEKLIKAKETGNTSSSKANATMEVEKQIQQLKIIMWKLNSHWKAIEARNKCNYLFLTQS